MKIRILSVLSALLLVFAVACGDDDGSGSTGPTSTTSTVAPIGDDPDDPGDGSEGDDHEVAMVVIEGAWARTSPTMAANGAAYMELTATVDDRLVGAAAVGELAESVEVHETAMDEDSGEMAMRQTDGIDLPAGETVALEPGGYHIMFLGLVEPLEPGTTFDLVLTFEQAGEVSVTVEVRDSADGGGMGGGGMGGGMGGGH